MINNCIKSKDPIVVGKFLVPSIARDLGLTIDDLRRLEDTVTSLDEAHRYEGVIFHAYLENNDFILTDEQRREAFNTYSNNRHYDKR